MLTNICALGPHLIFNNTYLVRHKVGAKLNRIDVLVFTANITAATATPPPGDHYTPLYICMFKRLENLPLFKFIFNVPMVPAPSLSG